MISDATGDADEAALAALVGTLRAAVPVDGGQEEERVRCR